ncbi:MAG: DUF4249 domain-containing protein [Chloroflexia bacterium]|nr:DUF4249 domain-containing protein [Chloroflexia bacterium]
MKTKAIYSIVLTAAVILSSCEKVIDYELNTTTPKLVIEANLTNDSDYSVVTLSKSKNFTDNNTFEAVSNALVIITDNAGNADTLKETQPGTYKPLNMVGVPGRAYYLTVKTDDEVYTAESQMPQIVNIDSISFNSINRFGEITIFPAPHYQDPANEKNYYRFLEYVDGERSTSIFISNDLLYDGQYVNQSLRSFSDDLKIEPGKKVEIVMMTIDSNVYDYFNSLSQISSGGGPNQTGTPANPITNITGGALGYFSACTIQRKSTIYNP